MSARLRPVRVDSRFEDRPMPPAECTGAAAQCIGLPRVETVRLRIARAMAKVAKLS
jgi:hypothetical protein